VSEVYQIGDRENTEAFSRYLVESPSAGVRLRARCVTRWKDGAGGPNGELQSHMGDCSAHKATTPF